LANAAHNSTFTYRQLVLQTQALIVRENRVQVSPLLPYASATPRGSFGSRLRENAGAKRALRILFPSLEEQKSGPPQECFALLDVLAPNNVVWLLTVVARAAFEGDEEKDSTHFLSVHVFTQPGSEAAI
jgi:hypothetical protein